MDDIKKSEVASQDRLSELPYDLILHILSFLPMIDVVRTTIENLWTTIPCLNFYDYLEYNNVARLNKNFIRSALRCWKGNKIMKFEFTLKGHFYMYLAKHVDAMVCFAKEKNVEELNIFLMYDPEYLKWKNSITRSEIDLDIYAAPECLNSCSSLQKLSLVGCNLRVPVCPSWNQLRSLRIEGYCFSERSINRVLSGAPLLEVFSLRFLESHENLNIQSTSLRKLKIVKFVHIRCKCYDEDGYHEHPSKNTTLRIECPNLEVFETAESLYAESVLTNVPSLTEVCLMFDSQSCKSWETLLRETLRQIFSAIQHVEKVALSNWCIQVLGTSDLLSPLSNVKLLKLADYYSVPLDKMMYIHLTFPNLKTLVIESPTSIHPWRRYDESFEFESILPNPFLFQLKTIEITSSFDVDEIYDFLEFALKHCHMLENMVIWAYEPFYDEKDTIFEISERLLRIPRSSKTAKIILKMIQWEIQD